MKRSPSWRMARLTVLLLAVTVAAAGLLTACASPRSPVANLAAARAAQPVTDDVVVVNCLFKDQVRPSSFILTCADGYDYLSGLHWVSWGSSEAFAVGTEHQNTCQPYCAAGKEISYPALVALWRPEPLPGHPGVRYFTRITRIYTSNRPPLYNCQGTRTCYPLTSTFDLWS